jgi:hypothetical protein
MMLAPIASVQAQKVYKIIQPDGRVTYSDQPPQDKAAASELPPVPEQTGIRLATPEEVEAAKHRGGVRSGETGPQAEAPPAADTAPGATGQAVDDGVVVADDGRYGVRRRPVVPKPLPRDEALRRKQLENDPVEPRRSPGR